MSSLSHPQNPTTSHSTPTVGNNVADSEAVDGASFFGNKVVENYIKDTPFLTHQG